MGLQVGGGRLPWPGLLAGYSTETYIICLNKTIERYQRNVKHRGFSANTVEENMLHLKEEAANMAKKIELLEVSKRQLLGEGLNPCSIDELRLIENQLEQSLSNIRKRKDQLFKEKIDQLKEEERILLEENTKLREKSRVQPPQQPSTKQQQPPHKDICDVETELFIGPPERRSTCSA